MAGAQITALKLALFKDREHIKGKRFSLKGTKV